MAQKTRANRHSACISFLPFPLQLLISACLLPSCSSSRPCISYYAGQGGLGMWEGKGRIPLVTSLPKLIGKVDNHGSPMDFL